MFKKLVVISFLILNFGYPAGAEMNQVVITTVSGQTVEELNPPKYDKDDDFLYEEKIVDLIVDQKTGELIEKNSVTTEEHLANEH